MPDKKKPKLIVFTIDDLVERTGIGKQTWRKYIKQGELKASKVGRRFIIYPRHFHKFIKSKEVGGKKK